MPGLLPDPALRDSCTRFLWGHGKSSARAWVERLGRASALDDLLDVYSEGPAMARLEAETAALLGKEAALFFHKGVTAQLVALLVHAQNTGRRVVALHARSHIALDEHDALDRLAGLVSLRVGNEREPFTTADLERIAEPLAVVTVEVPLRRAGFLATPWEEFTAISSWARKRGVPFHLDGARIWEVAPWYGRSLAEISALADTVYVSFYKGLGGMGGCVLAGPKDFIAAAKPWRARFGGDMPTIFPYVLTAIDGVRERLPRMGDYHLHAVAIAEALGAIPGVLPFPAVPHGNSFRVYFDIAIHQLERAAVSIACESRVWLFNRFEPAPFPGRCFGEIVVGEATLEWTPLQAAKAVADLLARAGAPAG
jgi:threonine aldolase